MPRTARRLEIVQEQIAKVAAVVRTLLDHSRRPGHERWPTSVQALLARVADVARPKLDASGISLDARCRRRPAADLSRQRGARARDPEPRDQQPRRHAGRRHADDPRASLADGRVRIDVTDYGHRASRRSCCRASSSRGSRPKRRAAAPASASASRATSSPVTAARSRRTSEPGRTRRSPFSCRRAEAVRTDYRCPEF